MSQTSSTPALLTLDASYASVRDIGRWLDQIIVTPVGAAFASRRGEIELAVHELAVNIVDHAFTTETRANATLELAAEIIDDTLFVRTFDSGLPVERLPGPPPPDQPQVRGYGLMIIEQLATSVHYQRSRSANRWTLSFEARPTSPNDHEVD